MLGVVLTLSLIGTGSAHSTDTQPRPLDPLGISDWNVTLVDEQEFLLPTEIFWDMREAKMVTDASWFQSFDTGSEYVAMNSSELFTLWCYTEDADELAARRAEYENKYVSISYSDGVFDVISSGKSLPSDTLPCAIQTYDTRSITREKANVKTQVGVKVTVTVEVCATWNGNTSVYFEVTDISYTSEKSSNPGAPYLDPVTDIKTQQSAGSHATAYANVWVETQTGLFSFSTWPAPFQFRWENGKYTGG